jgi:hypothetical protein
VSVFFGPRTSFTAEISPQKADVQKLKTPKKIKMK